MFRDPLQNEKLKVFDILTTLRECLTQSEKFLFLFAACRNGRHRFLYFMHKRLIICIKIFRASRDSATEGPKKIYINLIIMQSMQFFMHKFLFSLSFRLMIIRFFLDLHCCFIFVSPDLLPQKA